MIFKRTAVAFALSQIWSVSVFATEITATLNIAAPPPASLMSAQTPQSVVPNAVVSVVASPAVIIPSSAAPDAEPAPDAGIVVINAPVAISESSGEPTQTQAQLLSAPPSDLWDRIRAGYGMSNLDDEYVRKWEQFYASKPDYMERIVERGSRYWFYIVTEIERRGMPLEIALLPVIESAFVANANSSASAAGIWQFIPSTGKNFGMKQDWWADSRRDIVAATQGALDYLMKLHGMFGDWHLALASYNWGEGSVGRAIAANQAAGRATNYASLNMPNETRNYLPKLQAIKNIIANPSAFGVRLASIPNQPYFKSISIARHIDVDHAIKMANVPKEEFVALNPAHNRPVIGGRESHHILLPAENADLFLSKLEANDRPLVSWMAYKTRAGDRLDALAQRFGTSFEALRAVNGIRSVPSSLPAGYNLLVPSSGPADEALGSLQNAVFTKLPEYAPGPAMPRVHRVGKNETLASVAKRYGIAPARLAQWNRLGKGSRVNAGTLLAVSGPMPMVSRTVRVKKGGRYVMVRQSVPAVRVIRASNGKTRTVVAKNAYGKKRGAQSARKTRRA